jgi:peptidyl-prolyl cis-trans isomerase C
MLVTAVSAAQAPEMLASIGSRKISVTDFRSVMRAMQQAGSTQSTLQTLTPAGREKLLDALIEKELYALGARDEGLDRQPDVRFWMDQAVDEVLAKEYLERKAKAADVGEPALKAFYDAHPDAFTTSTRVKTRHILLKSEAEAAAVLAEAKSGKDFATLAEEHSIDTQTKAQGGDLGWVDRGVMVKPFDDLLFSLKKGEIGGPVHTTFGFHVVKADDIQMPAVPAFSAIQNVVRQQKVAMELQQLKVQLKSRHPVQIQQSALDSLGR